MAVTTSGGRDEIGESALRRSLNTRMDSSNEKISASMACCDCSFAWLEFVIGVRVTVGWAGYFRTGRANQGTTYSSTLHQPPIHYSRINFSATVKLKFSTLFSRFYVNDMPVMTELSQSAPCTLGDFRARKLYLSLISTLSLTSVSST